MCAKIIRIGRFCVSGRLYLNINTHEKRQNCDFTQRKHIVSHSSTEYYEKIVARMDGTGVSVCDVEVSHEYK